MRPEEAAAAVLVGLLMLALASLAFLGAHGGC